MQITDKTRPILEAMPSAAHAGRAVWGRGRKKITPQESNRYRMRIGYVWKRRGWAIPANWRGAGRRPGPVYT